MSTCFPLRSLAGLVAATVLGAATAAAQNNLALDVKAETMRVAPAGVVNFEVDVTNISTESINLRVTRTESNLPDTNVWNSAMCFGDACYHPTLSDPPPVTLAPNEKLHFKLTMQVGEEPNTSGSVKVVFAAGIFGERIEKEFTATVDASIAGVGGENALKLSDAYPNPVVSVVSIPLPTVSVSGNVSLELCNVRGERVADLSDEARAAVGSGAGKLDLNLSSYPSGRYFYRIQASGASKTGTIVIAR